MTVEDLIEEAKILVDEDSIKRNPEYVRGVTELIAGFMEGDAEQNSLKVLNILKG